MIDLGGRQGTVSWMKNDLGSLSIVIIAAFKALFAKYSQEKLWTGGMHLVISAKPYIPEEEFQILKTKSPETAAIVHSKLQTYSAQEKNRIAEGVFQPLDPYFKEQDPAYVRDYIDETFRSDPAPLFTRTVQLKPGEVSGKKRS